MYIFINHLIMKNILLIINVLLIMNLKINSLYDIIDVLYNIYYIYTYILWNTIK